MNEMSNQAAIAQEWNQLSQEFNTYKKDLFSGAADNIYTIWPVLLDFINKNILQKKIKNNLRALDYGCGTGMFCSKLKSLGFDIVGIDISPKMISVAKKHNKIRFFIGDYEQTSALSKKEGKFDLITAVMVLQFVPDIKECAKNFSDSLTKNGYIIFVVHNPKKLDERKVDNKFEVGNTGKIVTIYKRTAEDYDKIFKHLGFKKIIEKYQNSSKDFLKRYKPKDSARIPKYLILSYKKN